MEYKMEIFALILCAFPVFATSISISSNGNSPEIKLVGGMMVEPETNTAATTPEVDVSTQSNYEKSRRITSNTSNLTINERYRRLIPYMTFYYANDLTTPTTDRTKVEVEKAEIIEAKDMEQYNQRQPKKIVYSQQRTIPRYQGNRLTQFNIASANPVKVFYKDGIPVIYETPIKVTPNYNPLQPEFIQPNNNYNSLRFNSRVLPNPQVISIAPTTRKPYINFYKNEELPNVRYYLPEKESAPKFKLVPYEQTPPVKVLSQNEKVHDVKKPYIVSVLVPNEQVYVKSRPIRPQSFYDNINYQPVTRKYPTINSENYYQKQRPPPILIEPLVESGFKPIVPPPEYTTQATVYTPVSQESQLGIQNKKKYAHVEPISEGPVPDFNSNYYNYVVEQQTYKPEEFKTTNGINIAEVLKSLQLNKSIPRPITKENVGSSIRTLLQVLNTMKAASQQNGIESPVLSTPQPFVVPNVLVKVTDQPVTAELVTPSTVVHNGDYETIHDDPYLAPVKTPSQHLDDFPTGGGSSQQFPLPVTSDEEGGTPGRPGVDYPILTTIPQTAFNCKTQRYKGFFADTETRCQVWHYCDLNGGQASFLCPNGTIFSQAGLTCDWWFNVRCASTTQLYVLNESLYKYILPHSPKFPEDYSGPLVDKYLTLKFKEMEEQFKKNKGKQNNAGDQESEVEDNSNEASQEELSQTPKTAETNDTSSVRTINVASVVIESPGTSGNVERLQI